MPFDRRKMFKFWFPVFVYSGIIFYVSSLPNLRPPLKGINIDKIWHIGEYIPLGFLVARALFHTKSGLQAGSLVGLSVLLVFLYGLSDEFHQMFVQGRYASLLDVAADVIGAWIGSVLLLRWMKIKKSCCS